MANQYSGNRTIKRGTQGFTTNIVFDFTPIKQLKKNITKVRSRHIKVGWYEKLKHAPSGYYIAELARMQEFGSGKIPARSYVRQSLPDVRKALLNGSYDVFNAVLLNGNIEANIDKIGSNSKQAFQLSVMKQNMKSLSERTISEKKHGFQWDDTGLMLHHYKYKVFKSSITKAENQAKSMGR